VEVQHVTAIILLRCDISESDRVSSYRQHSTPAVQAGASGKTPGISFKAAASLDVLHAATLISGSSITPVPLHVWHLPVP
jgi:hypothetical protein